MEALAQLVNDSLARHGVEAASSSGRIRWSEWFHCQDSLGALFVPSKPGLLALSEELIPPGETVGAKRMLVLFHISEASDLGLTLGRLLLTGPDRQRVSSSKCFARYAVIEDGSRRQAALNSFDRWLAESSDTSRQIETPEAAFG